MNLTNPSRCLVEEYTSMAFLFRQQSAGSGKRRSMKPIPLSKITLYGELAMRANLNFARLETAKYWPETIFDMDQHAWPADWEGRTMLALTMHAQVTKREPAFLDDILERLSQRLNAKGYIGPVHPDGVAHEQTMAGHSWMLRALVEYYQWKRKSEPGQAAKAMIVLKSIVNGLYLPQTENYRNYPVDEETRYDDPRWILSHKQSKTKTHSGTSDCGCAFIALDGSTAAYELLGDKRLKPLIEAMISSYETLPREELQVQTHATLSGIRGILRYYRITGARKYLQLAIKTFDLYKTKAWTDHYANYNWFGLPRWTEPCAVVDSLLIAQELWEATGKEGYLQDAHHIFYNAIAHAERINGSFGTDACVGAKVNGHTCDHTITHAKALTYEVFWCCNMRGGDGLSRAAQYSIYTDGNSVVFPHYHSCKAELKLPGGVLRLREEANYPVEGRVVLHVLKNTAGRLSLKFFAPQAWTSGRRSNVFLNGDAKATTYRNGFVCVTANLKAGDKLEFDTQIKLHISDGNPCVNNSKDHYSFRHGPMILGVKLTLDNAESVPSDIRIPRGAAMKSVGAGRYETHTEDGARVLLQPMWGKENLTEPLDAYQVLFRKHGAHPMN